jgi:LysR family transcriptional regulator, cyn operon transcriptional activator
MLDDWFRLVGAEPVIVAEVDAIAPMLELVRRIDAAAIVSRLVVPEGGDLKVVPLQNPMPVRVPGILWRRDREPSDVARSFAAILRNAMLHAASRNKAPAES